MQKHAFGQRFVKLTTLIAVICMAAALDTPIRGFIDVLDDEIGSGRGRKGEDDFEEAGGFGGTTTVSSLQSSGMPMSTGIAFSTSSFGTPDIKTMTSHSGDAASPHHTPTASTVSSIVASSGQPSLTNASGSGLSPQAPTTSAKASGAYMPPGEAAQWKVIGLVVICIAFVAFTSLLIVFWDTWTGFVKSIVCCCRRKEHRQLGEEDLVPDWEKGSWEFRLATENGHRYPTMESLERIARAESMKQEMKGGRGPSGDQRAGPGMGVQSGENPFEPPFSTSPFLDPHPLEPLTRRPSTNNAGSGRRIV